MTTPGESLHGALRTQIVGDKPLARLIAPGAVYEDAETPRAAFPHIVIGDAASSDWSCDDADGFERIVALDVWSDRRRPDETHRILDRLRVLIDDAELDLSGGTLILSRYLSSEVRRDRRRRLYRGVVRFRFLVEFAAS